MTLALVALVACSGHASKLEGRWRGTGVDGVPPESMAAASAFANGLEIEVKDDVLAVTVGGQRQTGHFKVDAEDASSISLHTDLDDKNDKQTFVFVNEKTVRWAPFDGRAAAITFTKQ
jgi:hypothetical protein